MSHLLGSAVSSVRSSSILTWLAREPSAEVIVIDLRDTYTAGPVLALLDWVLESVAPVYRRSKTRSFGRRAAEAVATAPIRLLGFGLLVVAVIGLGLRLLGGSLTPTNSIPLVTLLTVGVAGTRVTWSLSGIASARPILFLRALFAPPDLSDEQRPRTDCDPAGRDDGDEFWFPFD